jgi:hypothetical protein
VGASRALPRMDGEKVCDINVGRDRKRRYRPLSRFSKRVIFQKDGTIFEFSTSQWLLDPCHWTSESELLLVSSNPRPTPLLTGVSLSREKNSHFISHFQRNVKPFIDQWSSSKSLRFLDLESR